MRGGGSVVLRIVVSEVGGESGAEECRPAGDLCLIAVVSRSERVHNSDSG